MSGNVVVMNELNVTDAIVSQLDWHWQNQVRPRLAGLTTEEYLWEPVEGSWNVRPAGTKKTAMASGGGAFEVDFEFPPPSREPVTTIAWRLAHVIVGVLALRNHSHFGGPAADYFTWEYAGTANEGLAQLDEQYARWIVGVKELTAERLAEPCGPAEGEYAAWPLLELVLHINREVIHHLAEVALLRDLYAHQTH